MSTAIETSDTLILDLLRKHGPMSVSQLSAVTEVTATAVRQRLTRLLAQGDIQRASERASRGRPSHRYQLTEQGRRKAGANFADLAIALWEEIRSIRDPEVRKGLLARISKRLAGLYAGRVGGGTLAERMQAVADLFRQRQVPFSVDTSGELPLLRAEACPYPELAEQDRSICAMEKMLFAELLGGDLRLSACRLDGETCCTFTPAPRPSAEFPPSPKPCPEAN